MNIVTVTNVIRNAITFQRFSIRFTTEEIAFVQNLLNKQPEVFGEINNNVQNILSDGQLTYHDVPELVYDLLYMLILYAVIYPLEAHCYLLAFYIYVSTTLDGYEDFLGRRCLVSRKENDNECPENVPNRFGTFFIVLHNMVHDTCRSHKDVRSLCRMIVFVSDFHSKKNAILGKLIM